MAKRKKAVMTNCQLETVVKQANETIENTEARIKRYKKAQNEALTKAYGTVKQASEMIKELAEECLRANKELKDWSGIASQITERQTQVAEMRRKVSVRG
jgi:uncharacterized protein YjcR